MSIVKNKTIVSIIFTHQARMRCMTKEHIGVFLNDVIQYDTNPHDDNPDTEYMYINDSDDENPFDIDEMEYNTNTPIFIGNTKSNMSSHMNEPSYNIIGGEKQKKLPRFKNGSVLEVVINEESIRLQLLVEGEIDEEKPDYIYYVRPDRENDDSGSIKGRYKVTPFNPVTLPNNVYNNIGGNTYVFYLVRHGQATHNLLTSNIDRVLKIAKGEKDTHLTNEGKKQAFNTGKQMSTLITKSDDILPPTYVFASDLRRTRETMIEFMKGFDNKDDLTIYILPCSHEVQYISSGVCDGNQKVTPPENISTCSTKDPECISIDNVAINWDYYYQFYGNSTRSSLCKSCHRRRCRDTDMIKEAIHIIKDLIKKKRHVRFSSINKSGGIVTRGKRKKKRTMIRTKKRKKGGKYTKASKKNKQMYKSNLLRRERRKSRSI